MLADLQSNWALVVRRRRPALQVVVEVVAVDRPDDRVRDVRNVQPVGERRRRLAAGIACVGEDGDAGDALGPAPARHVVGRERGPGGHAEHRVRRERGLDPFGDAEVTILRNGEEADRALGARAEHLALGRRLAAAVVEQEGAVDAADRLAIGAPRHRDHAGPAARGVVVGQVGMEQQIRTARVVQARGLCR